MKIEWEQRVRVAESAPLSLVAACCQTAEGVALPLAAHDGRRGDPRPERAHARCGPGHRRAQLSHGELPGGQNRARL